MFYAIYKREANYFVHVVCYNKCYTLISSATGTYVLVKNLIHAICNAGDD